MAVEVVEKPTVEVEGPAVAEISAAEDTHTSCCLHYSGCNTYELQPNRDQCGTCCIEGIAELEKHPSLASGNSKILNYCQSVLAEASSSALTAVESADPDLPAQNYLQ